VVHHYRIPCPKYIRSFNVVVFYYSVRRKKQGKPGAEAQTVYEEREGTKQIKGNVNKATRNSDLCLAIQRKRRNMLNNKEWQSEKSDAWATLSRCR